MGLISFEVKESNKPDRFKSVLFSDINDIDLVGTVKKLCSMNSVFSGFFDTGNCVRFSASYFMRCLGL